MDRYNNRFCGAPGDRQGVVGESPMCVTKPERECCVKDEGRPLEAAIQVEASNHPKLRW